MKAAWDWQLPRGTEGEQRALVEFAGELGFDTLIVPNPSEALVRRGEALGLKVLATVYARPSDAFVREHPECLQKMLPMEEEMARSLRNAPADYLRLSHRWFDPMYGGPMYCYEHAASQATLKERVREALSRAHGVAFDGFGFRNYYACFCQRCRGIREGLMAADHHATEAEVAARMSEESLVGISRALYEYARSVRPDAVVTNHVWPPFRPNWYYGCRLRLDFCSQTISWFYRPVWSLEQVVFEASEHKRLEDSRANRFVPFIGLYADPHLVRSPDRLAKEFEIAREFGDGNVVLCTLDAPKQHEGIRRVVKAELARM